eukprot:3824776-Rhodomonas_salina.1
MMWRAMPGPLRVPGLSRPGPGPRRAPPGPLRLTVTGRRLPASHWQPDSEAGRGTGTGDRELQVEPLPAGPGRTSAQHFPL